jgi:undecaprenyl diphosphate synthase
MKQSTLHVAIIMDGNGRWAVRRGLPRAAGHRAGAEALRRVVQSAPDFGVAALTVYAFSSDNWKRPPEEVSALMALLAQYLDSETEPLSKDGVRLSAIGRRDRLPHQVLAAIGRAECATYRGRRLWLRLAIDYSAREAILRASDNATRERVEAELEEAPAVDLLIRTGGEQRLSDFLLWESAYAELVFTPRMWPDFDGGDLRRAVNEFHRRGRRFGALTPMASQSYDVCDRWLR